jgi:hypothetical protein
MWLDDERVSGRVSGDDWLGRLAEPASEAGLVDEGAHVVGAEGASGKRASDSVRDVRFAVEHDQP